MKYLKMIGLAAIAAAALMAFVGAASASASTLCSTAGTGTACTSGKPFTGAIHANLKTGTTADLTGALPVSCTKSTVAGKATSSSPVEGTIETLTFEGCSVFGFECSVASVHKPYKVSGTATSGGNGVINVKSDGSGNPGASITCLGVTCEFTTAAAGANLGFTGSDTAPTIVASSVPLTVTAGPEGTCGKTATWNATYVVDTPSSLWLF